ncbi:MAG: phospholipase D-like domain-containing protein [Candidatus Thorarchaeota archaeon]
MRDQGLIVKCSECKKWYIETDGCSHCKKGKKITSGKVVFISDDATAPLIKDMISSAKDNVLIASPWMWGIDDIVQRLERLRNDRVDIAILTRRAGKTDVEHAKTVDEIQELNCRIDFIDELHAKIVLVDETEIYIGSANLVETSFERNKEAGIWTDDPATVADARDYLSQAFAEAFKRRSRK